MVFASLTSSGNSQYPQKLHDHQKDDAADPGHISLTVYVTVQQWTEKIIIRCGSYIQIGRFFILCVLPEDKFEHAWNTRKKEKLQITATIFV